ncbi:MAG: EAL domain-containing protein [Treponemataceae bacterium]|nr:EAL domain-containing protein [Treponemataceae bacterium]
MVKKSILLVEPSVDNEKALSSIVSANYGVVTSSPDERTLLSLLRDNSLHISAAIIDIEVALPLLKMIRSFSSFDKFPVLISIEDSDIEIEEELLDLDIIDFLKKPFNARRVLNRLKTALRLYEADKTIDELERDELTSLYTRTAFLRKAEHMRDSNPDKNYCVVGFDFDNFKSSNSLYGEEKCDEFLAFTGQKLKMTMPNGIAGRFGGDQFILFYEYKDFVDEEKIGRISSAILEAAPVPHQIVKIGIYAPVDPDLEFVVCCDRAFLAIREIKGIYGKNVSFYEDRLHNQLLSEQRIVETMEKALEEGQFQIFYQPKHETITCKIAGAEALVRWNHPEYGLMLPGLFIPIFEKNGFITKLDTFIIRRVCMDIKRWQEKGLPVVPVSVNISRRDFMEQDCFEKHIEMIDSYGIPHELLHLEVTESLYSENTEIIASKVKKAQDSGFLIEMDDFGAGYSSLGLLSSFSLDVLKLDISFVRNITLNEIVIENVIKMAHRMGLLTVAEGAESSDQVKTLRSLGCDLIQGFYFSEPLPVTLYEDYLSKKDVMTGRKNVDSKSRGKEFSLLSETMLMAANEVAEGIPGGFFSYHADEGMEIISFNGELMNMYECESAEEFREYTGNSFRGFVLDDDFPRVQESIHKQIAGGSDLNYVEYRLRTKNGGIRNVRYFGRFVRTKKYGDIFYVFVNDITDEEIRRIIAEEDRLKKIEFQRSAELAESANKAKNIFMYNIAKDILPPIKKIIEYTESIENNLNDADMIRQSLKGAKRSEELMLGFMSNIFEFAQIENGELKLTEFPTDVTDAIMRTYALFEDAAKTKGVEVEFWSDIKHPYIYQDLAHTSNVVLNIISNALKYTPPGGKIRFGLRQKEGRNDDECIMEFICEDNGIGISKEFLPFICKSFTREDNEINRQKPSAGLGLNIASSLLFLMHGSIDIQSEKGKGTTVRTSQPHRYARYEDIVTNTTLTDNMNE